MAGNAPDLQHEICDLQLSVPSNYQTVTIIFVIGENSAKNNLTVFFRRSVNCKAVKITRDANVYK